MSVAVELPERIGRYELVRLLGVGGMAQVHLAHQLGPAGFVKPCVVKRMAPSIVRNAHCRRMFLEEARVSALLSHPHIVQTFDYGEADGVPYIAMELVDGFNLAVLAGSLQRKNKWLPLRVSLEIVHQVADALAYAHEIAGLDGRGLNLVHRDVSPQNILLSRQWGAKLGDFGIARRAGADEEDRGSKGKPGYMAPEQQMGDGVDGRADIYGLGVVLLELVAGRRFSDNGRTPPNIFDIPRRVEVMLEQATGVPEPLRTLIVEMTAIDPQERPATARIVAARIETILTDLPTSEGLQGYLERIFEGTSLASDGPSAEAIVGTAFPTLVPEGDRADNTLPDAFDLASEAGDTSAILSLDLPAPEPELSEIGDVAEIADADAIAGGPEPSGALAAEGPAPDGEDTAAGSIPGLPEEDADQLSASAPLEHFLRSALFRVTGDLVFTRPAGRGTAEGSVSITYMDGRITELDTTVPYLTLPSFLVKRGLVSEAGMQAAIDRAPLLGGDLGYSLISLALIEPQVYLARFVDWARYVLAGVITWSQGTVTFRPRPVAAPVVPLELDRLAILIECIRAGVPRLELEARAGDLGDRKVALGPLPAGATLDDLKLEARELRAMKSLDGTRTAAQLLVSCQGKEELRLATLRALYLAKTANLLV